MKAIDSHLGLTAGSGTVTDESGTEFRIWSLAPAVPQNQLGMSRDRTRTDFVWLVRADGGMDLALVDVPEAKILKVAQSWATSGRMAA
jgi:hypothetical protein